MKGKRRPDCGVGARHYNVTMMTAYIDGDEGTTDYDAPVLRRELGEWLSAMHDRRPGTGSQARGAQGARGPPPPPGGVERTSWPTVSGCTAAQVQQHMSAGTCFKCGKTGHMSRQCPKRVTPQSN